MKMIALIALMACGLIFGQDVRQPVLSPLGGWPLCEILPGAGPVCFGGPPRYLLLVWPSSEEVGGISYRITAVDDEGEAREFEGYLPRNPKAAVTDASIEVVDAGTTLHNVQIQTFEEKR